MAIASDSKSNSRPGTKSPFSKSQDVRLGGALSLAKEQGLLAGPRTRIIRGRMPAELVDQAKANTGIASDSKLIEAALAHLAVEDNYWKWFTTQRGTVDPKLDLIGLID
jgi:hypothetical protein